MVKHKEIFIPNRKMNDSDRAETAFIGLSKAENVIAVTVEELRDMWRLAMQHGVRPYDTISFEDFIESKGIQL